jgi:hypothetical protein
MPAKGKQKMKKAARRAKAVKAPGTQRSKGQARGAMQVVKAAPGGAGGDLAAEVKRLAREMDAIKVELSKRPAMGGDGGSSRRDQDKVVADRLARLDEKVEAVWNRLADLEERVEGEGAGHGHDADELEEAPEKDFYDR